MKYTWLVLGIVVGCVQGGVVRAAENELTMDQVKDILASGLTADLIDKLTNGVDITAHAQKTLQDVTITRNNNGTISSFSLVKLTRAYVKKKQKKGSCAYRIIYTLEAETQNSAQAIFGSDELGDLLYRTYQPWRFIWKDNSDGISEVPIASRDNVKEINAPYTVRTPLMWSLIAATAVGTAYAIKKYGPRCYKKVARKVRALKLRDRMIELLSRKPIANEVQTSQEAAG